MRRVAVIVSIFMLAGVAACPAQDSSYEGQISGMIDKVERLNDFLKTNTIDFA